MKRKNITISDELADWYEKYAKEGGMTQSSLMAMALLQWREQKEILEKMQSKEWLEMMEMMKKFQEEK